METTRPQSIIDVIYSAESIKINEKKKPVNKQKCEKCGFMTSNKVCKACILLEGLNKSKPKIQMLITEWLVILVLKLLLVELDYQLRTYFLHMGQWGFFWTQAVMHFKWYACGHDSLRIYVLGGTGQ